MSTMSCDTNDIMMHQTQKPEIFSVELEQLPCLLEEGVKVDRLMKVSNFCHRPE